MRTNHDDRRLGRGETHSEGHVSAVSGKEIDREERRPHLGREPDRDREPRPRRRALAAPAPHGARPPRGRVAEARRSSFAAPSRTSRTRRSRVQRLPARRSTWAAGWSERASRQTEPRPRSTSSSPGCDARSATCGVATRPCAHRAAREPPQGGLTGQRTPAPLVRRRRPCPLPLLRNSRSALPPTTRRGAAAPMLRAREEVSRDESHAQRASLQRRRPLRLRTTAAPAKAAIGSAIGIAGGLALAVPVVLYDWISSSHSVWELPMAATSWMFGMSHFTPNGVRRLVGR